MVKNTVVFVCLFLLFWYIDKVIKLVSTSLISVQEKELNLDDLLYGVDDEGSTLLHLAVDSGSLPVRRHDL